MSRRKIVFALVLCLVLALTATAIAMTADDRLDRRAPDDRITASCQKCGDGRCVPQCENANTCPQDCGPGGGTTSATPPRKRGN